MTIGLDPPRQRPRSLTRRRMLCVTAAACAAPLIPNGARAVKAERMPAYRWRGIALGVPGRIIICHPQPHRARAVAHHCVDELRRLERIFSLYDPQSEICRLNRKGRLDGASLDLRLLLRESQRLGEMTEGAFDITVQPLWQLYAAHFRSPDAGTEGPSPKSIAEARRLVDFHRIEVSGASVGFLRQGMAITLNGIAQGYIDDRIADILRNEGFDQALIDLGEIRSLTTGGAGKGWRIGIEIPGHNAGTTQDIALAEGALATSSGASTAFESSGRHHHLFDPATGYSAKHHRQVSVISPRATLSDALATALAVMPADRTGRLLAEAGADRALLVSHDGTPTWHSPE